MKKNKLLYISSAALLGLTLASCGNGTADSKQETTTVATTTKAPASQTVEKDYSYSISVLCGNNPISGVGVQLCNDKGCRLPVATDDSGVAKLEAKRYPLGDYIVHLNGLDEKYTYNPNGNKLSTDVTTLTINIYETKTATSGEGTVDNPYVVTEGYYNQVFTVGGQFTYYSFVPTTAGTYEFESYAIIELADIPQDAEFMDITAGVDHAKYSHDDGYGTNFKYSLTVTEADINKEVKFVVGLKTAATKDCGYSFSVKKN